MAVLWELFMLKEVPSRYNQRGGTSLARLFNLHHKALKAPKRQINRTPTGLNIAMKRREQEYLGCARLSLISLIRRGRPLRLLLGKAR